MAGAFYRRCMIDPIPTYVFPRYVARAALTESLIIMYTPSQFKSDDLDGAVAVMRKHSFATLICNDDEGLPFVTYPDTGA
jgi:hypothetical protein